MAAFTTNKVFAVRQNVKLASFTTFHIGGRAKFFAEVENDGDLKEAVKFAQGRGLDIFVLGGGSNILLPDEDLNCLALKINIKGIDLVEENKIKIGAGEAWDDVVASVVGKGLWGIENLSLIPGTAGGAVYQNIGAYGAEIKDVVESVKACDVKTGAIVKLSNKECGFEYRSSVFKKNKNLMILEAELLLSKDAVPNISYPDLTARFANKSPSISQIRNAVIEIRKRKIPYPDEVGNAGSFFKNPVIPAADFQNLLKIHSDLRGHNASAGFVKLSAAQLIEKCGWKGKRLGNVGVSEKHALVLVNYGNGTARELAVLEAKITKSVQAEFGLKLAPEVEKIGPFAKYNADMV